MKLKTAQSAASLRILLFIALLLILSAIGGGFYIAQKTLRTYAADTSKLNSQASASSQGLSALRQLESYLEQQSDDIARANDVVAESKQYKYQDEIIRDISSFAASSGVAVTSFEFTDSQAKPAASSSATTSNPAAVAPIATPAGVTPTTATITLAQPVNYKNLLNFIYRIEKNVTKMQIANVSISRSVDTDGTISLSSEAFKIEVYLRQ